MKELEVEWGDQEPQKPNRHKANTYSDRNYDSYYQSRHSGRQDRRQHPEHKPLADSRHQPARDEDSTHPRQSKRQSDNNRVWDTSDRQSKNRNRDFRYEEHPTTHQQYEESPPASNRRRYEQPKGQPETGRPRGEQGSQRQDNDLKQHRDHPHHHEEPRRAEKQPSVKNQTKKAEPEVNSNFETIEIDDWEDHSAFIDRARKKIEDEAEKIKRKEQEELEKLKNYRGIRNTEKKTARQEDEMDYKERNSHTRHLREQDRDQQPPHSQQRNLQKKPRSRQPEVDFDKKFGETSGPSEQVEPARSNWGDDIDFGDCNNELTFGHDESETKKKSRRFDQENDPSHSPAPTRNQTGFGKFKK